MRRILYLTPGTEPDGSAAHVALLCQGLPRERFEVQVCTLAGRERVGATLKAIQVPLIALGWTRLLDPRPVWRLRRLIRDFQPDLIHAFRPVSLRALALSVGRSRCPLVVSRPLPPRANGVGAIARLDRWLLGRADRIVVDGNADADRCLRAGFASDRIVVIPPGIALPEETAASPTGADSALLCAGRLEAHKGYRDAIWAFDILHYVCPELRLILAGEGPDRRRLERFARRIHMIDQVEFAGVRADLAELMARSEVAWVPSLADGGVRVALEAMAAGRPVVASRLPGLAEVIVEGETGYLVPPGDKIALARQTRRLLADRELRRCLGQAGRARIAEHFAARAALERTAELYQEPLAA